MRGKRVAVVALSALDALIALAIGLAIPLVPLTLMWVTRLDAGLPWDVYWRASADIWLLGHGVDFTVTMDAALAASFGLAGAEAPFRLSLAPLAFALITMLLAVRLGRRAVESGTEFIGPTAAILTFAGAAVLVALGSKHPAVSPSLWQALLLPGAIFAVGVVIGARGEVGRSGGRTQRAQRAISRWISDLPVSLRAVGKLGLRGAAISVASLVSVAAVLLAVMILANFTSIIALYEGLQGGVAGSLAVTAVQLLYIPVFVVWAASWLVGPGFAIGAGSAVTPVGSSLGLVPALPILGALPPAHLAYGFVGLVVPVMAGFLAGYAVRGRADALLTSAGQPQRTRVLVVTPVAVAIFGGILMGLLCWVASGSAGPGRLSDVGPQPFVVGGVFSLQLLVSSLLGMLAPRPRRRNA